MSRVAGISVTQALGDARAAGSTGSTPNCCWLPCSTARARWLIAHGDEALEPKQAQRFAAWCSERAAGVPLAYLLGEKEFHGLTLHVDRNVLVPRPDTETLVDWALELLRDAPPHPKVLDLGTGSGAIALAIAHAHPDACVCATDLSGDGLEVARANGVRLGLAVEWLRSDWWSTLAGRRFDFVLSNPPYVAGADPHLAALAHEPLLALTPGGDGLGALRTIASSAARHLHDGGWLLLEHGYDQAGAVQSLLREAGLRQVATRDDLAGRPRCTAGRRLASM